MKGLPRPPSKEDGQWSSIPLATHSETPIPLCPTPSPSLLTQGENYFEPREYSSIERKEGCTKESEV